MIKLPIIIHKLLIFNDINNISILIQNNNSTDNIINNKRIIKSTRRISKKVLNYNIKIDNNNENKNGKAEDHNKAQQRKSINNKINDNDSSNKINKMKTVNNVKINNMDTMKNENLAEKEKKQKPTIQMMRNHEQYNIFEDLLNIPANITIGQFLNISKISKDELMKGIKNSKQNENIINAINSTINNNYNNNDNSSTNISNKENYSDINYNFKIANNLNNNNSIVHEHDVAVVRGYIY